jgi:hypothetical protein
MGDRPIGAGAGRAVTPPKRKKVKPPSEPKPERRWRAPVALAAAAVLLLCGYAFYFLDHLPQAESIRPGTRWAVEPTEQLRLHGLEGGTVLRLNFASAAAAKLSFPAGTRLSADGGAERGPSGEPLELSLFNADRENSEIALEIRPPDGGRATLTVEPRSPDPNLLWLRVHSASAPLVVTAQVVVNPSADRHGELRFEDEALEDATATVPAGAVFSLGLRTEQLGALRKEVGTLDDGVQKLELSAVEIGTEAAGDSDRRWLACGARRGRVLWQRPRPGLKIADCGPGWVSLAKLDLTERGALVDPQGAGYTVRDGETRWWQGFRDFRENNIVAALLGLAVASLTAWGVWKIVGRRSG